MFGVGKRKRGEDDYLDLFPVERLERHQSLMSDISLSEYDRSENRKIIERYQFERPSGGWLGWVSKLPGPLPSLAIAPVQSELAKVRSYRFGAFMTVVGAIAALLYLSSNYRSLAISPMSLLFDLSDRLTGGQWFGTAIAGLVLGLAMTRAFKAEPTNGVYGGKILDNMAAREELWFRAGAESWTTWQRVRSCIGFGLVHVVNMFYPITSIAVLMLVGGVFMFVYLRAYKRTGSTKLATLESTSFHATYNRFAFLYLIVAIGISVYAAQS